MSDLVRQRLAELIARYGHDLSSDARRCESLLKDVCPKHKREIFLLVSAVTESVTVELLSSSTGLPKEVQLSRLTKRLNDSTGVAENMARWAVESWALALGIANKHDFRFPFKCPGCDATGTMPTRLAGQTVNCPNCKATLSISVDGRDISFYVAAGKSDDAMGGASTRDTVSAQSSTKTVGVPTWEEQDLFAEFPHASAEDVLRQAIRRVLADGIVTDQERAEVQQLCKKLGIAPDAAQRIAAEVKAETRTGISPTSVSIGGNDPPTELPPPLPSVVSPWLVTTEDFAQTTRQFWLSGRMNSLLPSLQVIAGQQPIDSFVRDIHKISEFFAANDLPVFAGEAWVGGGINQTMRLTTYRMILTTPNSVVVVYPLSDILRYSFCGTKGTLRGAFLGSVIEIARRQPGTVNQKWQGKQLAGLHFPYENVVRLLINMQLWCRLPPDAQMQLGLRRTETMPNK